MYQKGLRSQSSSQFVSKQASKGHPLKVASAGISTKYKRDHVRISAGSENGNRLDTQNDAVSSLLSNHMLCIPLQVQTHLYRTIWNSILHWSTEDDYVFMQGCGPYFWHSQNVLPRRRQNKKLLQPPHQMCHEDRPKSSSSTEYSTPDENHDHRI